MNDYITTTRKAAGFLDAQSVVTMIGKNNAIYDPHSLLVSEGVTVGSGNVFYPNVVIERKNDAMVTIGDNNILYPGTYFVGTAGAIRIGNSNEFGPAGCIVKANMTDADITIGDSGRYCDGVSIMGVCNLGTGSQVLGNITVQSCKLAAGGTFQEPDPDNRAAVLKGFGLARGVSLKMGQVVNGTGNFSSSPVEWQHDYHPKPQDKQ